MRPGKTEPVRPGPRESGSSASRLLGLALALAIAGVGGGVAWRRAGALSSAGVSPASVAEAGGTPALLSWPLPPPMMLRAEPRETPAAEDAKLEALIEREPRAAVHWLETQPDSALRRAQLNRALNQWSGTDPIAAGAWVSTLPPGADREAFMAMHAGVLRIESPRTAALWLATFPAAEQPLELIEALAREWSGVNRAAAAQWLADLPLPAERRERLLAATSSQAGPP